MAVPFGPKAFQARRITVSRCRPPSPQKIGAVLKNPCQKICQFLRTYQWVSACCINVAKGDQGAGKRHGAFGAQRTRARERQKAPGDAAIAGKTGFDG
ncbi:hypothetical protein [Desulfovibrio sp. SGI.169]|uniref:hypothetical protein n=1 Tax=Desulfovibrio sp. SGI.169 TaxID=3420561 RepID=UPI003D07E1CE